MHHHPLPEKPDEAIPAAIIDEKEESTSIYSSESEVLGDSNSVTDAAQNTENSWSTIQSYTRTGTSMEQSSVFSWGYEEFDKSATQQVQCLFGEIDEFLYENKRSTEQWNLQDECKQWASRFPHLRILGKQMVMPIDEGYAWLPSPVCEISNTSSSSLSQDQGLSELCIFGKKTALSSPFFYKDIASPKPTYAEERQDDEYSGVLVSEGVVEEYLAFDCRSMDDSLHERKKMGQTYRLKSRFPPVSPLYCMEYMVLNDVFDDLWKEMVSCMHELVWQLWGRVISDELRPPANGSAFLPSEAPQVAVPRVHHTQVSSFPSSLIQSQVNRLHTENGSQQHNLNGLMVIQGIPLQQRNLPLGEPLQNSEDILVMRLGSSLVQSNRSQASRTHEHSTSSLSRTVHSARRRNLPRTLYPLHLTNSRSGTPGSMDEIIRGTRLSTASDHLSSPPAPLSRNSLLPPIGSADSEHSSTVPASRQQQKLLANSGRIQSAFSQDASRQPPRERLLQVHSRPNTTHTFQSDIPLRRSLTVLEYANQYRTGRGTAGTDAAATIGVTGISLGITTSSYVDSFHHHALGHSPVENEEDDEDLHPFGHQLLILVRSANQGGVITKSKRGL
ncbi:primary cilium assembly protein FAM149B1 isoform X2 [Protopterus annectens]|uniref:primary cilium assembly protein FAM149B1 isoform X2 n=1 Tax=Protopterus annectens TaxID=7888 RepID=UPI001CFAE730|nr:primary cilium assembly protein FAM149B1 isoform X2 [Protopterus annectens]